MSRTKAWLKVYYPVTAQEMHDQPDYLLILHGYMKWRGARFRALDMYGLWANGMGEIRNQEGAIIKFDGSSCALCQKYQNVIKCPGCPIAEYDVLCQSDRSAWSEWMRSGDPERMISLLRRLYWKSLRKYFLKWWAW